MLDTKEAHGVITTLHLLRVGKYYEEERDGFAVVTAAPHLPSHLILALYM